MTDISKFIVSLNGIHQTVWILDSRRFERTRKMRIMITKPKSIIWILHNTGDINLIHENIHTNGSRYVVVRGQSFYQTYSGSFYRHRPADASML